MAIYEVSIQFPGFCGTLELLVEQVRRFEMDILDVRLSAVAAQLADDSRSLLDVSRFSNFLTLSKLMFLKSRNLLPGQNIFEDDELEEEITEEQQEEATRVRERLEEIYGHFKAAGSFMRQVAEENANCLRSYQTRSGELPGFIDEIAYIEQVTPFDLLTTMNKILRRSMEDRTYHVKVDDAKLLSDRISEIFSFLLERRGESVNFTSIMALKPERPEMALTFLAVVYLVSEDRIIAKQATPYGEINIIIKSAERRPA